MKIQAASKNPEVITKQPEKCPLNISVAYLACFLKVFCDEKLRANVSLSDMFNFVSSHFSTVRRENISAGSLSENFYSTTQVTAAKVQGIQQQMIARINQHYFPLVTWIGAGAALCFFP